MLTSYQYRLKPNRGQEKALLHLLSLAARLYNLALEQRKLVWRQKRRGLSYNDQAGELKALREECPEFKALNYSAAQQVLRRLDKAFKTFFRTGKGYPRFKKPHRFRTLDFTYGDGVALVDAGKRKLRIQNVGEVRIIWHRDLPEGARIRRVLLTRKANGWYATFQIEVPEEKIRIPLPPTGRAVGVDVGLENLLALSDGRLMDNPRWSRKLEARIAGKQRILARKVKGSKRWQRLARQIAKLHLKVARQRRDFYFKLARELVQTYDLIALEDLNLKGLQGGMLSKGVADAGWGIFLSQVLPYQAWKAGREVVFVSPNGTSQTCSACGAPVPKELGDRWHACPVCGYEAHRDINAAQVILQRGLVRAHGGPEWSVPVGS